MGQSGPTVLFFSSARHDHRVVTHHHRAPELILVKEGKCEVRVKGLTGVLTGTPGDLFVLPRNRPHNQRRFGMSWTLYTEFDLGGMQFDETPRVLPLGINHSIARWMDDLLRAFCSPYPAPAALTNAVVAAILEGVIAFEQDQKADEAHPEAIRTAMKFLRERFREEISVKELAHQVHVSPSQLFALFKEHIGTSPIQCQQELRMQYALTLLRDKHARVVEVATECGYGDANYFVRLFRKKHGLSPNAWRKAQGIRS
jgi:AraC-like DNA-binding protein